MIPARILAAALAAAWSVAPAMAQGTKVTIGISGWTGFAPLTLAKEAGIYAKHGLVVWGDSAEEAYRRKSGARGLRAILEELMLDVMYEIPSLDGVKECVVDRSVVESRKRPELVFESKAAS